MFLFRNKPKTFLGIDIGASAIKLVELAKEDERYKLNNYAVYSLEKYLEENKYQVGLKSFLIPVEEVAQLIKQILKQAEIKTQQAYFSIPVAFNFSTLAAFPNMSDKELASAVPYEAQKYVPIPISEVVLDWSVVSRPQEKEGSDDQIKVLLVAAPKKVLADYKKISQLTGLKINSIEEETFSLVRSLIGNDKSTSLLIDLGARSINLSIINEGYVWLSHNLEIGGVNLTKKIADKLEMELNQAENLKKDFSQNENVKVKGIINEVLGPAMIEVKRIVDDYQKKYGKNVEKCILAGGGSEITGFSNYLSEKIGLEVVAGNPFARVAYPEKLNPVIKNIGPSMAVAVGLAMR